MKRLTFIVLGLFVFCFASANLYPQVDFVKLQKEEEKRKKKTKKSKYVVNNDNLKKIKVEEKKKYSVSTTTGTNVGKNTGGSTAAALSSQSGEDESGGEKGKRNEKYWQNKKTGLVFQINTLENDIARMESWLFQQRGAIPDDIYAREVERQNKITATQKELKNAKEKVVALKAELAALEQQAKENAVPIHWMKVDKEDLEKKKKEKEKSESSKGG